MSDTAWTVVVLVSAHFIGDWKLQSREMAVNKSTDFFTLLVHLSIISVILMLGFAFLDSVGIREYPLPVTLGLLLLNAVIHGIIDWNIWGGYKARILDKLKREGANELALKDYKYWEDKGFYDTIGFDQFLHLITLAILFL